MAMGDPMSFNAVGYSPGHVYCIDNRPVGIVTGTANLYERVEGLKSQPDSKLSYGVDISSGLDYSGSSVVMPDKDGEDKVEVMTSGEMQLTLDGLHNVHIGDLVGIAESSGGELTFKVKPGEPVIGVVIGTETQMDSNRENEFTSIRISIAPHMMYEADPVEFDGGSYTTCDSQDFEFSDNDFTVECWCDFDGTDGGTTFSSGGTFYSWEAGEDWFGRDKPEQSVSDLMMQDFNDDLTKSSVESSTEA